MILLLLFSTLVFQSGDTLKFIEDSNITDIWTMGVPRKNEQSGIIFTKNAKVSKDNKYFFIYEEFHSLDNESVFTILSIYDANRNRIQTESLGGERKISFDLTNIYKGIVILATTHKYGSKPSFYLIRGTKNKELIINENEWLRIVNYEISPNLRYIVFHTLHPQGSKIWDYIYFIDLEMKKNWSYLYPVCLSCRRGRLDLNVDNDGKVEVIRNKNECHIFSKDGELIDIFTKID